MITLDSVDEAVIAAFAGDGRQSNREVARQLNVSEGTVRQRLKKLQDAGAVQFDVITDARQMGIGFIAFVRISAVPARLEAILEACCAIPEVWYVAATAGRYNAICLVCAPTAAQGARVIQRGIDHLHGIHEVNVRPVVGTVRNDFREIFIPR